MNWLVLRMTNVLPLLAMAALLPKAMAADGQPDVKLPAWVDEVQTYNILPMLPERAKTLNISVNGVWAGIPGRYPVLPHLPAILEKYQGDQRRFVLDGKAMGLITCGVVNGIEGFEALRADVPNLEDMACRKANGDVAGESGNMILMCTNNPDWLAWEIETGKKAIDLGVDLVMHDTPMSAAFLSGFLGAGCCDSCMSNFEQWLTDHYTPGEMRNRFGLAEFDKGNVIDTLSPFQKITPMAEGVYVQDTPNARLFQEFIRCQEESMFRTRVVLMKALREHARTAAQPVAFCTNAADLGTANPGGHWVRAIMFSDLFDFFSYEQNSDPEGKSFVPMTDLPRGKWAAFHKLAYAIKNRRSPALLHTHDNDAMGDTALKEGKTFTAVTAAFAAESYAANGAYMTFYGDQLPATQLAIDRIWQGVYDHFGFVHEHKDVYQGAMGCGSPLAFLFLYNERGRTIPAVFPSYLGLAQGFVEGSYPFDVVFGGDDHYIQDRLDAEALTGYEVLIVPSPIAPTESQAALVQDFVRSGGTVVCQEPDLLGLQADIESAVDSPYFSRRFGSGEGEVLVLAGEVTRIETGDVGTRFFREYSEELRKQTHTLAEDLGLKSVLPAYQDGLVSAFPLYQPEKKRIVVHLVNYDIDREQDVAREKTDLEIVLQQPDFLGDTLSATCLAPSQKQTRTLECRLDGDSMRVTLPSLAQGATVIIAAAAGAEQPAK